MKKVFTVFCIATIFLFSCKDDDTEFRRKVNIQGANYFNNIPNVSFNAENVKNDLQNNDIDYTVKQSDDAKIIDATLHPFEDELVDNISYSNKSNNSVNINLEYNNAIQLTDENKTLLFNELNQVKIK